MKYESLPISELAKLLVEQPLVKIKTNRGQYFFSGIRNSDSINWRLLLHDLFSNCAWYSLQEFLDKRPTLDDGTKLYKEIYEERPFTTSEFINYLEVNKGHLNIKSKLNNLCYQLYKLDFSTGSLRIYIDGHGWLSLEEMYQQFTFYNPTKETVVFGITY